MAQIMGVMFCWNDEEGKIRIMVGGRMYVYEEIVRMLDFYEEFFRLELEMDK